MSFRPTARFETLHLRARLLNDIRAFFLDRNVLEVETPSLSQSTVTSPYIESLITRIQGHRSAFYLQTSPEFAMKRLLAAGSGCIYQICKAFRDGESGQRHNPEFTMLEWYRIGFDHYDLMDEMDQLLQSVAGTQPAQRVSYRQLFLDYLGFDPFSAEKAELIIQIQQLALPYEFGLLTHCSQDDLFDILIGHVIEPQLGQANTPTFVYDFPSSQAALARISTENSQVAERFEVYLFGMELANGFHELADAEEQKQRFLAENQQRKQKGLAEIPIDQHFIAALQHGLPDCAGVALGVDRLLMAMLRTQRIEEVLAFPAFKA